MYAEFFGLTELPFNNTPDPRFFFPTPDHEEALASMIYAISESKGFMLLTGEVGAGKTLLTKMVLHHFGNRICAATINHASRSVGDLLASVCYEFGIPVPSDAGTAACTRALQDFLIAHYSHNTPVVLLIDEAQALPPDGFEQLRMLGNLEDDNAKLLQTLIVGQPELRRIFQARDMRQLRQRLFRTFHLPALDLQQCQGYIRHRLGVAGAGDSNIFDDSAIAVIHQHAQGLPRLINTICDNAMLSAYSADNRTIDGGFVDAVISQMLTLDQRQDTRVPTHETHGPSPVGHYHAANERITQIESLYAALATRLGGLEERCQLIGAGAAATPPSDAPDAGVPAPRAEDTAAPFVAAVDKLRRSILRTEKKLIVAVRHTDQQVVRLASKTDQVARQIPELAASSVHRDQQVRRLTAIVRQLVEPNKTSAAPLPPLPIPPAPAEASPEMPPPTVAAVSGQLEALVSRTAASMNDLRLLIDDVTAPVPSRPKPRAGRPSAAYDSPVASLAEELRELTALTAGR